MEAALRREPAALSFAYPRCVSQTPQNYHCLRISGAPVFWLGETEPRNHRFAGVAVRATYSSGIGHFVHGSAVLAALEKALADSQPSESLLKNSRRN